MATTTAAPQANAQRRQAGGFRNGLTRRGVRPIPYEAFFPASATCAHGDAVCQRGRRDPDGPGGSTCVDCLIDSGVVA